MNIFRLLGDLSHMASKAILIWSIHRNKSAEGISFLTQAMYALVFMSRYLDLFYSFVSLYNTVFKIVYILSAFYVLFLMRWIYPHTPEGRMAWQASGIILGSACLLSLIVNYRFTPAEVLWSFSIVLESLCVIPQLILLRETTTPTVITSHYFLALGSYRALYIPNWIYRYMVDRVVDPIAVVFGIIQTAFYLDFAWVYYSRQRIKLRDGMLVDSDDYERGWLMRWLRSKGDTSLQPLDRDGAVALPDDDALAALEGQVALPPDTEEPALRPDGEEHVGAHHTG
ncbi:ER lumen protein retaining receptor-domain-containing protein [Mycena galopus ATCC 62051]|nr:ER lumen protein retaining receptor-domain-containing protein [Mycena galopus ATCC 62051]